MLRVGPFCESGICQRGVLAFRFAFAKQARSRFGYFRLEFAFALPTYPAESIIVKIVEFKHR